MCLSVTGDAVNNFINENFHLVLEEVGQPAYRALGQAVHQILKGLADRVPYDELFTKDD
jgi:regulator of protease activity HflC (stomatin/prohibitin superfamily)